MLYRVSSVAERSLCMCSIPICDILTTFSDRYEASALSLRWKQNTNCEAEIERKGTCCRDADVKEEGFLEYINQLVMTGEVAGLFPKDEMDAMINDIRPVFKREATGNNLHRPHLICSML